MPSTKLSVPKGIPFVLSIPEAENPPLLSLIIPVWNGGEYFKILTDNICQQLEKYPELQDKMEVIMSLDEPSDGSDKVAEEAAGKFPGIIKTVPHKNTGLVGNRNIGMQLAQGKYLIWADHDDSFKDGAFSRIIELLEQHEPDILAFHANLIDKNGKHIQYTPLVPEGTHTGAEHILAGGIGYGTIWDLAIKNELIRNFDLYPLKYWLSEDYTIRIRALMASTRVVGVNECFYSWRLAGESASHNDKANQKYFDAKIFYLIHHLNNSRIKDKKDYKAWNTVFFRALRAAMAIKFRTQSKLYGIDNSRARMRFFFKVWLKRFGFPKDSSAWKVIFIYSLLPCSSHIGKLVTALRKHKILKVPGM